MNEFARLTEFEVDKDYKLDSQETLQSLSELRKGKDPYPHACNEYDPNCFRCEPSMMNNIYHNSDEVAIPLSPWDEIQEGVYIGGSEYGYPGKQFDAVISAFDWTSDTRESWLPDRGVPHISVPFSDGSHIPSHKVEMLVDQVEFWSKRGTTLVRCQAGLNRSSLIVARWLIKYRNHYPVEAIEKIREKRSKDCLFNKHFVNYILNKR